MNQFDKNQPPDSLGNQARRLRDLVSDIVACCQDRQVMESRFFGMPQAELKCLLALAEGRYLASKDLAVKLEVTKSRISKLLEGLLSKGMVLETPDPRDRRVKLISLSSRGAKTVQEVDQFITSLHQKVLSELEPDQRKNTLATLEILWGAMENVKSQLSRDIS